LRFTFALILALLTYPVTAETQEVEPLLVAAENYVIYKHDEKTNCKPCITKKRARLYVKAMFDASCKWDVPFNIVVGFIGWESAGFQNTVDKTGSGSRVLPISSWCFGMGKLKVSTANDFTKYNLGWERPYITGRELLYDPALNIDVSVAYLRWCLDLKENDLKRGLNAYKAGPTGEKRGEYWMNIRMPNGSRVRKTYAQCVLDYSVMPWIAFAKKQGVEP